MYYGSVVCVCIMVLWCVFVLWFCGVCMYYGSVVCVCIMVLKQFVSVLSDLLHTLLSTFAAIIYHDNTILKPKFHDDIFRQLEW